MWVETALGFGARRRRAGRNTSDRHRYEFPQCRRRPGGAALRRALGKRGDIFGRLGNLLEIDLINQEFGALGGPSPSRKPTVSRNVSTSGNGVRNSIALVAPYRGCQIADAPLGTSWRICSSDP